MEQAGYPKNTTNDCIELDAVLFTLPPTMTIETAESLAAELKQLPLAEKTQLTLDASQVEHITTAGLQLILSLEKTLSAQGGVLKMHGKRSGFIQAFHDAGLQNYLTEVP